MSIDELAFAREQLKRAVRKWADTVDEGERTLPDNPTVAQVAVADALALLTFPSAEFLEYRDLVRAAVGTVAPDKAST